MCLDWSILLILLFCLVSLLVIPTIYEILANTRSRLFSLFRRWFGSNTPGPTHGTGGGGGGGGGEPRPVPQAPRD